MTPADWFAHGVLRILAANSARFFGWSPLLCGDKISNLNHMISAIEREPDLLSSVPRALRALSRLHFLKAASFGEVGNAKDEELALSAAVEADPSDRALRFCRAMRWLPMHRIAPAAKLAELRRVVDGAAPDNRDMETAHAAAAMLLVSHPALGTEAEARAHWDAARCAGERIRRAHGAAAPPTSQQFLAARAVFEGGGGGGGGGGRRGGGGGGTSGDAELVGPIIGMLQAGRGSECTRCGRARNETGAALNRCPCRRVWYCGRECQRADWPAHKALCRSITAQSGPAQP
jgi:hypothetical protein